MLWQLAQDAWWMFVWFVIDMDVRLVIDDFIQHIDLQTSDQPSLKNKYRYPEHHPQHGHDGLPLFGHQMDKGNPINWVALFFGPGRDVGLRLRHDNWGWFCF